MHCDVEYITYVIDSEVSSIDKRMALSSSGLGFYSEPLAVF